ncbi:MAG: FecR family protein [Verrucomicrobiota bacterium]
MNPDFLQRIERYFEGEASDEDIQELDLILREYETARKQFLHAAQFESSLSTILMEQEDVSSPPALVQAAKPPRRRPRWMPTALAAALLILLVGTIGFFINRDPTPDVLRATVSTVQNAGAFVPGHSIRPGARIELSETGVLSFAYQDGTEVTLKKSASLSIPKKFSNKRLFLQSGELMAQVTPQPTNQPMVVETPRAFITVKGTHFRIAIQPKGELVAMEQGAVEIREKSSGDRQKAVAKNRYLIEDGKITTISGFQWNFLNSPMSTDPK